MPYWSYVRSVTTSSFQKIVSTAFSYVSLAQA